MPALKSAGTGDDGFVGGGTLGGGAAAAAFLARARSAANRFNWVVIWGAPRNGMTPGVGSVPFNAAAKSSPASDAARSWAWAGSMSPNDVCTTAAPQAAAAASGREEAARAACSNRRRAAARLPAASSSEAEVKRLAA